MACVSEESGRVDGQRENALETDIDIVPKLDCRAQKGVAMQDLRPDVEHTLFRDDVRWCGKSDVKIPVPLKLPVSVVAPSFEFEIGSHVVHAAFDAFSSGSEVVRGFGRSQFPRLGGLGSRAE